MIILSAMIMCKLYHLRIADCNSNNLMRKKEQ